MKNSWVTSISIGVLFFMSVFSVPFVYGQTNQTLPGLSVGNEIVVTIPLDRQRDPHPDGDLFNCINNPLGRGCTLLLSEIENRTGRNVTTADLESLGNVTLADLANLSNASSTFFNRTMTVDELENVTQAMVANLRESDPDRQYGIWNMICHYIVQEYLSNSPGLHDLCDILFD